MNVLRREAIEEVFASAPNHLGANHRVRYRIKQQVARCVVTTPESIRCLSFRVRDVEHRVANRTREALVPRVIEIGHESRQGKRDALYWRGARGWGGAPEN